METIELLPLSIKVSGKVIKSNLNEFRESVKAALATFRTALITDEDFGQAKLDVAALKSAEEAVKAAKKAALAEAESINALFTGLDDAGEEIRQARLTLERQIDKRTSEVKADLAEEYLNKIDCADRLRKSKYLNAIQGAIKGKQTLDGMRKALEIVVTVANGNINLSRRKIAAFVSANGQSMVPDREELELDAPAIVEAELRRRLEAAQAEAERKRLAAEAEKERAEAARLRAEAAERERIERERAVREALPVQSESPKPTPLPEPLAQVSVSVVPAPAPEQAPSQAPDPELYEDDGVAEWSNFRKGCLAQFAPIKALREALRHPRNIAKAQQFADTLNKAWKEAAL